MVLIISATWHRTFCRRWDSILVHIFRTASTESIFVEISWSQALQPLCALCDLCGCHLSNYGIPAHHQIPSADRKEHIELFSFIPAQSTPEYPHTPTLGELTTGSNTSSPHSWSEAQSSQTQPSPELLHCLQIYVAIFPHESQLTKGGSFRARVLIDLSESSVSRSFTTLSSRLVGLPNHIHNKIPFQVSKLFPANNSCFYRL